MLATRFFQTRRAPIAVARAQVIRADGSDGGTHYSVPSLPWHHFKRRIKLAKHLRFMRREDAQ